MTGHARPIPVVFRAVSSSEVPDAWRVEPSAEWVREAARGVGAEPHEVATQTPGRLATQFFSRVRELVGGLSAPPSSRSERIRNVT